VSHETNSLHGNKVYVVGSFHFNKNNVLCFVKIVKNPWSVSGRSYPSAGAINVAIRTPSIPQVNLKIVDV
jgi:hypothetical protein